MDTEKTDWFYEEFIKAQAHVIDWIDSISYELYNKNKIEIIKNAHLFGLTLEQVNELKESILKDYNI